MIISKDDYFKRARELYGEDTKKWKFICTGCQRIQSAEAIKEQMEHGEASQRHGLVDVYKTRITPECECFSPTCNWVSYGLFNSGILVVIDPSKPHNANLVENCCYAFPLADDAEMLKAAGVTKQ